jgi:hypothetical protein
MTKNCQAIAVENLEGGQETLPGLDVRGWLKCDLTPEQIRQTEFSLCVQPGSGPRLLSAIPAGSEAWLETKVGAGDGTVVAKPVSVLGAGCQSAGSPRGYCASHMRAFERARLLT